MATSVAQAPDGLAAAQKGRLAPARAGRVLRRRIETVGRRALLAGLAEIRPGAEVEIDWCSQGAASLQSEQSAADRRTTSLDSGAFCLDPSFEGSPSI